MNIKRLLFGPDELRFVMPNPDKPHRCPRCHHIGISWYLWEFETTACLQCRVRWFTWARYLRTPAGEFAATIVLTVLGLWVFDALIDWLAAVL